MFPVNLLRAILPLWIGLLVYGSFMPAKWKRALGTQAMQRERGWPHRVWHLGSFGSTALLASASDPRSRRRRLWPVLLIGLGAGIEITQHLNYRIHFEWEDIRDDAVGILVCGLVGESRQVRRALVREERGK
jgi:hypothetical protein